MPGRARRRAGRGSAAAAAREAAAPRTAADDFPSVADGSAVTSDGGSSGSIAAAAADTAPDGTKLTPLPPPRRPDLSLGVFEALAALSNVAVAAALALIATRRWTASSEDDLSQLPWAEALVPQLAGRWALLWAVWYLGCGTVAAAQAVVITAWPQDVDVVEASRLVDEADAAAAAARELAEAQGRMMFLDEAEAKGKGRGKRLHDEARRLLREAEVNEAAAAKAEGASGATPDPIAPRWVRVWCGVAAAAALAVAVLLTPGVVDQSDATLEAAVPRGPVALASRQEVLRAMFMVKEGVDLLFCVLVSCWFGLHFAWWQNTPIGAMMEVVADQQRRRLWAKKLEETAGPDGVAEGLRIAQKVSDKDRRRRDATLATRRKLAYAVAVAAIAAAVAAGWYVVQHQNDDASAGAALAGDVTTGEAS